MPVLHEMRSGEVFGERTIAVVGSGIAGLSAAWLLSQRHKVTLYEADERVGGHAHTIQVPVGLNSVAVDTGFIVYNEQNYPNLVALLDHLGAASQASNMSFAASLDNGALEYSSNGLNGLIGQRGNIGRGRFWLMMLDIVRFYREAPGLLERSELDAVTLGEYLDANNYCTAFIEDHLLPMGAAIWSISARDMRLYPLKAFIRFFNSHSLLNLTMRPKWRTVTGGSREYVSRLMAQFKGETRLGCAVTGIRREAGMVQITDMFGRTDQFSDVVIASHADQTLKLLADADGPERSLLGAMRYSDNAAVLHSDISLMPRRRRVWSSWNYIGESCGVGDRPLCVTYWMNRLQQLETKHPLLVTLNPTRDIAPDKVIGRFGYSHPLFDAAALAAQQQFWRLQGQRNTWFCGSYFGYGFHEDALQSGLSVAEALGGVRRPWSVQGESDRISLAPLLEAAE
ncbi:NAD(P)/FAD-dependent oxidoreductase [uncultured Devosia sp.]|uniref:NAD(P)/FAD-dependent oxidoreductase n=1 Tax=uncultured Devosia sp. TaxID=211434 RepID=UPI0035C9E3EB